MIRWTYAFIDRPAAHADAARAFWTAVTDTRLSAPRGDDGEFATLLPPSGDAYVKFQAVREGGGAHLDFAVEDPEAFAAHAVAVGARRVAVHDGWTVLASPAGLAFCAVPWHGEARRPAPVPGLGMLDQVCLDIPERLFDAEAAFWPALTGWETGPGALPEFRWLRQPPGLPLRILLQRLTSPTDTPGAHIDLACGTDTEAIATAHEKLGATRSSVGTHWLVMRDPSNTEYCLTARDPNTGAR
ncbi:VOC family protein [Streptomyces sp. NPDC051940]|uniref:VOC family protein n=1 Tax=Streptomyces sp. NPDC051940 TaxID=3155675 RepID=UPI003431E1EA